MTLSSSPDLSQTYAVCWWDSHSAGLSGFTQPSVMKSICWSLCRAPVAQKSNFTVSRCQHFKQIVFLFPFLSTFPLIPGRLSHLDPCPAPRLRETLGETQCCVYWAQHWFNSVRGQCYTCTTDNLSSFTLAECLSCSLPYSECEWRLKRTISRIKRISYDLCENPIKFNCYRFFSCLHTKSFLVTQLSWHSNSRNTPNMQNHTLIISLWLSFQFHKTLFAKHNTQFSMQHTQI